MLSKDITAHTTAATESQPPAIKNDIGDDAPLSIDSFIMDATDPVGDSESVVRDNHQRTTEKLEDSLTNDKSELSHVYFVSDSILHDAPANLATTYKVIGSIHIESRIFRNHSHVVERP
ncbi:hypothetical protein Z517_09211 [Fonsecaea pedrosoi CBS 271.37]|uniref:Uncharacterized protein n=1 Tax=Fonsecaea pedrosoi CBS 271.37 TaxID=1442368 RepID=A0A0D2ER79_9EURO|nr:uncharacterized protein Z517_09211 [Fonsecaea pedrosoi CBS 271.37]KIW76767.1 hypothetical protein Z517_09211 [Fonsecaea pedrosoi CBS 271.37]